VGSHYCSRSCKDPQGTAVGDAVHNSRLWDLEGMLGIADQVVPERVVGSRRA
jgi:hypothetical protein